MRARRTKAFIFELLLCLWVVGAQIWYVFQFRPLVAFFAAKFLHKS